MMISTRGRYALRVMVDLAEHTGEGFVPLKEIAERQEISEKYLESIIAILSRNQYLIGMRGKGGGYKLARAPEEYTIGSILQETEGNLAPVACLSGNQNECSRKGTCRTLPMWEKLDTLVHDFFEGITLKDLIQQQEPQK
ncbi:RrF2 family transcriptional regulator [Caproicibacterium sp. BJN0003]|uniref:RrF2 family transcriptional regulator n=1 Tax=Caproicibacterium sp. BJN0003 TaxID=2994078 RepID=UPI003A4C654E